MSKKNPEAPEVKQTETVDTVETAEQAAATEQKPEKKAAKASKKPEKKTEKKADKKPAKKAETKAEQPAEPAGPSLEQQLVAEKDKYLRMLAEYDNFRRRSAKERESLYTDVRAETVKKFLPVYDSLCRALAQTPEDDVSRKGLEMIMQQYETVLDQLGVKAIEALGKPFDANFHNAVFHIDDEAYGESEIVEEFEKGFLIGDKVLRYSVVKVAN